MICPTCQACGSRSRVRQRETIKNLVCHGREWDEDGNEVPPPAPTTATRYTCSRGHEWTETS